MEALNTTIGAFESNTTVPPSPVVNPTCSKGWFVGLMVAIAFVISALLAVWSSRYSKQLFLDKLKKMDVKEVRLQKWIDWQESSNRPKTKKNSNSESHIGLISIDGISLEMG